jgi:hypothetical protein
MAAPIQSVGAQDAAAITKSDTTTYSPAFDALWIGGAGDVTVRTARGTTVEFVGAAAGTVIPISADRVMDATTATDIVGLRF